MRDLMESGFDDEEEKLLREVGEEEADKDTESSESSYSNESSRASSSSVASDFFDEHEEHKAREVERDEGAKSKKRRTDEAVVDAKGEREARQEERRHNTRLKQPSDGRRSVVLPPPQLSVAEHEKRMSEALKRHDAALTKGASSDRGNEVGNSSPVALRGGRASRRDQPSAPGGFRTRYSSNREIVDRYGVYWVVSFGTELPPMFTQP